jgi:hypothetical protein
VGSDIERAAAISQRVRKRVEEIFGRIKSVDNFRRTRYRGVEPTIFAAYLVGAAYNLLRIAKLCLDGCIEPPASRTSTANPVTTRLATSILTSHRRQTEPSS